MHNFNLLPWREMRQKKHLKSLALDFGFVVLIGVIITFIWLVIASEGLSNQYERNEYLRTQNIKFLKNNAQLIKLEKEKLELIRKIELLNNLEKERQKVLGMWFGLSQTLPDTAYLISIEKNKDELVLEGRAENSKAVAQFMRALEDSPGFDRPMSPSTAIIPFHLHPIIPVSLGLV